MAAPPPADPRMDAAWAALDGAGPAPPKPVQTTPSGRLPSGALLPTTFPPPTSRAAKARAYFASPYARTAIQLVAGVAFLSLFVVVPSMRFPMSCQASVLFAALVLQLSPRANAGARIMAAVVAVGMLTFGSSLGGAAVSVAWAAQGAGSNSLITRLVGVTNPFFVRALGGAWPTVVSVGDGGGSGGRAGGGAPGAAPATASSSTPAPAAPAPAPCSMLAPTATSPSRLRRAASAGAALAGAAAGAAASALRSAAAAVPRKGGGGHGGGGGLAGHAAAAAALAAGRAPPAVWSALPRAVRPDKELLAGLHPLPAVAPPPGSPAAEAVSAAAASNSAALRSHFWRLTTALLSLFEDAGAFDAPGPPPGAGPLPPGGPPPSPPFSHTEFLARVAGGGGGGGLSPSKGGGGAKAGAAAAAPPPPPPPPLPILPDLLARFGSRPALAAFLRRFLASPNFAAWFERRRAAGRAWQAAAWEEAGLERGTGAAPGAGPEVALMEAWGRVESALAAAARVATLSVHARRVYDAMPADLQAALLSAPARAAMLEGAQRE